MISFIENNEHRKSKRRLQQTLGVTLVLLLLLFSEFLAVIGNPQTVYAQSAMPATSNGAAITAIVGAQSAVLLAVPGGETVQPLAPGVALTAIGRNADDQWVQIETSDGVTGWIKTATLILFGISQLPVVDVTVVASESQPIIVADHHNCTALIHHCCIRCGCDRIACRCDRICHGYDIYLLYFRDC